MALLKDYHHFDGQHWATGYIANALAYQGVKAPHTGQPYSEALIMGVNGGICAGYFTFHYQGHDPQVELLTYYPFNDELKAVYDRLNLPTDVRQTDNPTKATANVVSALARGLPAIVWADIFTLSYTAERPFAEYQMMTPVLVYGHEGDRVSIADRARVALEVSAANLQEAQGKVKKFKRRVMTLGAPDADRLPDAVRGGIQATIDIFTAPPHFAPQAASSFGFAGLTKWAKELVDSRAKNGWGQRFPCGSAFYNVLKTSYRSLELFYTGGGGARERFADFLDEAAVILGKPALREVAGQYRTSAKRWRAVAQAHLPEDVPFLKETRDLMHRSYDLFMEQGGATLEERSAIDARLKALRAEADQHFPLNEADCAALREALHDRILDIHDVEKEALDALQQLLNDG